MGLFNECKSNLNDYNLSKGTRYICTECAQILIFVKNV